jgi:outer membrane protein TolC
LPSVEALVERAQASEISEASRAEILARLASEESRVAALDAVPQFAPRVTYQHTNDGGDFFGVGIAVPLPIWDRNQGERGRTEAEARLAVVRAKVLAAGGLEVQVRDLFTAATLAHEQAETYERRVAPSFLSALRAEERLYGQGKVSVIQVWQTFRAFVEADLRRIQLRLEAASLRSQLSVLVGEEV